MEMRSRGTNLFHQFQQVLQEPSEFFILYCPVIVL